MMSKSKVTTANIITKHYAYQKQIFLAAICK